MSHNHRSDGMTRFKSVCCAMVGISRSKQNASQNHRSDGMTRFESVCCAMVGISGIKQSMWQNHWSGHMSRTVAAGRCTSVTRSHALLSYDFYHWPPMLTLHKFDSWWVFSRWHHYTRWHALPRGISTAYHPFLTLQTLVLGKYFQDGIWMFVYVCIFILSVLKMQSGGDAEWLTGC